MARTVAEWMLDEAEHARFEAHVLRAAAEQYPDHPGVPLLTERSPQSHAHYVNTRIQHRWEGWLAAKMDTAEASPSELDDDLDSLKQIRAKLDGVPMGTPAYEAGWELDAVMARIGRRARKGA